MQRIQKRPREFRDAAPGDDLVVATDVHELAIRRSGSCC